MVFSNCHEDMFGVRRTTWGVTVGKLWCEFLQVPDGPFDMRRQEKHWRAYITSAKIT